MKSKSLYQTLLDEYEVYPSDLVYEMKSVKDLAEGNMIEKRDERYRKYNLVGQELSWYYEGKHKARELPRKRKKKLNNRIKKYYKNINKSLTRSLNV